MPSKKIHSPEDPKYRLDNSPFYLMAHADHKYHFDLDMVLEQRGMSLSIYRIMTVLAEHQPASISTISNLAIIKRSTVSRIVERMTDCDLVTTQPAEEDGRITEVSLTPVGTSKLKDLTPIIARQFSRAIRDIDEVELANAVVTIRKIVSNLSKSPIE